MSLLEVRIIYFSFSSLFINLMTRNIATASFVYVEHVDGNLKKLWLKIFFVMKIPISS